MSANETLTRRRKYQDALFALGVASSPKLQHILGINSNDSRSVILKNITKQINNTGTLKTYQTDLDTHILDFSPKEVLNQGGNLIRIISTEVDRLTPSGNRTRSKTARADLLNIMKFDEGWASEAIKFIDTEIRRQATGGRGWAIAETDSSLKTVWDYNAKKIYYPKLYTVVAIEGNQERAFGAIESMMTILKKKANEKALKVQGGSSKTIKTKSKKKKIVLDSSTATTLTSSTFDDYNPNRILEVNFWLNGILDIKEFIEKPAADLKSFKEIAEINIGHVIGVQAQTAAPFLEDIAADIGQSQRLTPDQKQSYLTTIRDTLGRASVELNYEQEKELVKDKEFIWHARAVLLETDNAPKGRRVQAALKDFTDLIILQPGFADYLNNFLDTPGSKTPAQEMGEYFETIFLTDKFSSVRKKDRAPNRSINFIPKSSKISAFNRNAGKVVIRRIVEAKEEEGDAPPNLAAMIAIINARMAAQLRKNMGQGSAPKKLNWRTGRFARSAEVKALLPTRGKTIEATITYLRNPYDVFAQGGRLHNELRDPEKLIGKSIRQLLAENFGVTSVIRTRLV